MKNFIIILFFALITSCVSNHDTNYQKKSEIPLRYKVGDIVYLKPDSVRAVIEDLNKCTCGAYSYKLYYFNKNGEKITENGFKDALIY